MKLKELIANFDKYQGKTIKFTKKIEETELFFDCGMKAILANWDADKHGDGSYQLVFHFAPFMDYNRKLMRANYYDDHSKPSKTAEQAGWVPESGIEDWYFDENDEMDEYFTFVDEDEVNGELFKEAVELIRSYNNLIPTPEASKFLKKIEA